MSGRQYTVAIKLVDKDGILGKIGAAAGGKSSGGGGSSSSGGILDKLSGLGAGQLLKLTGIGLGIAELVRLGVKSSGILQANFKLWETSMMLIFKPITDFFGMILRPFTIMMLQWFVLPFYKTVYPFFHKWGEDIAKFFTAHPEAMLTTIAGALTGAWILKQTSWPKLEIPSPGGGSNGGGSGGSSGFQFPKCIELCSQTTANLPKPIGDGVSTGINTSLLIPLIVGLSGILITSSVTQMETKDEITKLNQSLAQAIQIPGMTPAGGKRYQVDLQDTLKVADSVASVQNNISTDWGKVAIASGAAATAAVAIATALDAAKTAIVDSASRLAGLAGSIPNSFVPGMKEFGPGGRTTTVATRTTMMGLADARSI